MSSPSTIFFLIKFRLVSGNLHSTDEKSLAGLTLIVVAEYVTVVAED